MSDETNDPGAPGDEGASEEQPPRSVWYDAPTAPAAEPSAADEGPSPEDEGSPDDEEPAPPPESTGPPEAEGSEAGGADADVVTGPDQPEPADEAPTETPAEPPVPEGTEAGGADADVVTGADVDSTDEAADEAAEPAPDAGADTAEGEADAPAEVDAEADAPAEVDAEAGESTEAAVRESTDVDEGADTEERRAELEQEIDRQLGELDLELDDDEEGAPVAAGDEADALLDQLDVDDAAEAPTVPTAWVDDVAPVEQPVRAGDEATDELTRIVEGAELAERSSRGPIVPLVVIAVLVAAVIGIVIAVGSGGDETDEAGGSTTSPPTTAGAAVSPDLLPMTAAEALQYFEVYGTQDPTQLPRMLQLSAPDTPAGYYAIHQETLGRIDPQRNAPLTVTLEGDEIEACPADPATGGCVVYGGFTKNAAGLLTHFTVNGTPLRDRMAIGTGNEVVANSMRISIISRYISVSDRLFIAFTVHNDGTTPIAPVSVRYITPSGETVAPDNDTFRTPVPPGTSAVAAAAFPSTAAGGTLAVTSTSDGGNSQQLAQIGTP